MSAYARDQPSQNETNNYYCDVCEKKFNGPKPYQAHMASKAHKEELALLESWKKFLTVSVNFPLLICDIIISNYLTYYFYLWPGNFLTIYLMFMASLCHFISGITFSFMPYTIDFQLYCDLLFIRMITSNLINLACLKTVTLLKLWHTKDYDLFASYPK